MRVLGLSYPFYFNCHMFPLSSMLCTIPVWYDAAYVVMRFVCTYVCMYLRMYVCMYVADYMVHTLHNIAYIKFHVVSSNLHDVFITGGFVSFCIWGVGFSLVVCFHTDDRLPGPSFHPFRPGKMPRAPTLQRNGGRSWISRRPEERSCLIDLRWTSETLNPS